MIRLTVQDGKMVQTLSLGGEKVFLGRLEGNTIRLEDASVSRKHAMIRRTGDGDFELLDLNSRHGVLRNGEAVARAFLAAGDDLRIGEVRIRVESIGNGSNGGTGTSADRTTAPPEGASTPAGAPKTLLSDVHRTTFAEEFYNTVRKTPWWAASLCFHMILVWLLFSIPFFRPPGEEGLGMVKGKLNPDFSSLHDSEPLSAKKLLAEPEIEAEPMKSPVVKESVPLPVDPPPVREIQDLDPPVLGPTTMDFSSTARKGSPFTSPEIPDVEFGQAGAESANQRAGEILKKALRGRAGDTFGVLSRMKPRDVLVVQGHYDHVESILDLLELKKERREEVTIRALERTSLKGRKILLVNCSNERPSRRTVLRIRKFVEDGGYLLTTDWGIENVLKDAFPGYMEPLLEKGRNVITPNEVIRIHAAPDQGTHFLLQGTSFAKGDTKWWLEESSYPFVVKNPDAVEVLIESDELEKEYGARTVAATFRYGKGRVLHMLGHFFQKEGNLRGAFSTQRLIANFLVGAIRHR